MKAAKKKQLGTAVVGGILLWAVLAKARTSGNVLLGPVTVTPGEKLTFDRATDAGPAEPWRRGVRQAAQPPGAAVEQPRCEQDDERRDALRRQEEKLLDLLGEALLRRVPEQLVVGRRGGSECRTEHEPRARRTRRDRRSRSLRRARIRRLGLR